MKDYDINDPRIIENIDAVHQSVMLRLTTEKGSFVHDPNLGSELHKLLREKPAYRNRLAVIYTEDALAGEEDIKIVDVRVEDIRNSKKTGIIIHVSYEWYGYKRKAEVEKWE